MQTSHEASELAITTSPHTRPNMSHIDDNTRAISNLQPETHFDDDVPSPCSRQSSERQFLLRDQR
jgi:hypothetical protein